jgi:hypothetical protein
VRGVSRKQAEGMTEFDAVTRQGLRKRYGSGVVIDRLDFDVPGGEMAGGRERQRLFLVLALPGRSERTS